MLELVGKLVCIYGLGEKNVHCLLTHSCMLQLLQLLLFEQLYISQKGQIPLSTLVVDMCTGQIRQPKIRHSTILLTKTTAECLE